VNERYTFRQHGNGKIAQFAVYDGFIGDVASAAMGGAEVGWHGDGAGNRGAGGLETARANRVDLT
jgi:hypothetical protein